MILIRLEKPASLWDGVSDIRLKIHELQEKNAIISLISLCIFLLFLTISGRTSEGGALPSVVQHVEVPILTLNQCRNMVYFDLSFDIS